MSRELAVFANTDAEMAALRDFVRVLGPTGEPATFVEKLAQTWPARLAQGMWGAVTLPRDVLLDPNVAADVRSGARNMSDKTFGRAIDFASLPGGGIPHKVVTPEPVSGSVMRSIRRPSDPHSLPQRPFSDDYGSLAQAAGGDRLTRTIEGAEIRAPVVVGRRVAGGVDEGVRPEQIGQLIHQLSGAPVEIKPRSQIPGRGAGAMRVAAGENGPVRRVYVADDLAPAAQVSVAAHELGHLTDHLARSIDQAGIRRGLGQVYSDLASDTVGRTRNLSTPQGLGYSHAEAPSEMMAEAIRAYLINPNYLKTAAPEVARRIRESVNTHPAISPFVQFNQGSPLLSVVTGAPVEAFQ